MAFHALADYQNHVIGWLQWEQSSLGEWGRGTISANLDVIWGMSAKADNSLFRRYAGGLGENQASSVGRCWWCNCVGHNRLRFGGWVTGGTAQKMAEKLAQEAVVARLAPICVEQYNQESEKDQKLKELKGSKSWERDDYVEKQGWATMPGEKEADSNVAGKCAELLVELGQ